MNRLVGMYVKVRELRMGQTMTEYALILAAIAVAVYGAYSLLGHDIENLVNAVQSELSAT